MNLIVGNVTEEMKKFIKKQKFTTDTLIINKMCNVKYITEPIILYIPFGLINRFGLLNDTMVHIEELFITLNIKKVYYGDIKNKTHLLKLSKMYSVEIELLDNK